MIENEVAVVIEQELALLAPEVRGSAERLEDLLDPDFGEIGKSGRLWTRAKGLRRWSLTRSLHDAASTSAT